MTKRSPSEYTQGLTQIVTRLGQATLWGATDVRVERREDKKKNVEHFEFTEITKTPTPPGVNRKPKYDLIWSMNWDALVSLSDLLNAIIDTYEQQKTWENWESIEMSKNDTRFKNGSEHEETP